MYIKAVRHVIAKIKGSVLGVITLFSVSTESFLSYGVVRKHCAHTLLHTQPRSLSLICHYGTGFSEGKRSNTMRPLSYPSTTVGENISLSACCVRSSYYHVATRTLY